MKTSEELYKLFQSNPANEGEIMRMRAEALKCILKGNRKYHEATKEDIRWFWDQEELGSILGIGPQVTEPAKEFVRKNLFYLTKNFYNFWDTEWITEWYKFMPMVLETPKEFNAGRIDWSCFFSIVYPLPPNIPVDFNVFIHKLNIMHQKMARLRAFDAVWNDPFRGQKTLDGEMVLASVFLVRAPWTLYFKEMRRRAEEAAAYDEETLILRKIKREAKYLDQDPLTLIKEGWI